MIFYALFFWFLATSQKVVVILFLLLLLCYKIINIQHKFFKIVLTRYILFFLNFICLLLFVKSIKLIFLIEFKYFWVRYFLMLLDSEFKYLKIDFIGLIKNISFKPTKLNYECSYLAGWQLLVYTSLLKLIYIYTFYFIWNKIIFL